MQTSKLFNNPNQQGDVQTRKKMSIFNPFQQSHPKTRVIQWIRLDQVKSERKRKEENRIKQKSELKNQTPQGKEKTFKKQRSSPEILPDGICSEGGAEGNDLVREVDEDVGNNEKTPESESIISSPALVPRESPPRKNKSNGEIRSLKLRSKGKRKEKKFKKHRSMRLSPEILQDGICSDSEGGLEGNGLEREVDEDVLTNEKTPESESIISSPVPVSCESPPRKNRANGEISSLKSKSKTKGGRNPRRRKIRILNPLEVTCVFCNKKCRTRPELFDHLNSHTGERPFDCKLCGATFQTKAVLMKHSKIKHTSARKVKCELCQKTFRNQYFLRNHRRHVHERKEILQCKICLEMFSCKSSVLQHLRGVHRSEFTDEPSKWKEFFVDVPVPEEVKATEEAYQEWKKRMNRANGKISALKVRSKGKRRRVKRVKVRNGGEDIGNGNNDNDKTPESIISSPVPVSCESPPPKNRANGEISPLQLKSKENEKTCKEQMSTRLNSQTVSEEISSESGAEGNGLFCEVDGDIGNYAKTPDFIISSLILGLCETPKRKNKSNGEISSLKLRSKGKWDRRRIKRVKVRNSGEDIGNGNNDNDKTPESIISSPVPVSCESPPRKNRANGEISSLKSKSKTRGGRNPRRRKIRILNPLEVTCVFCNKKCRTRPELFDHLNSHTGERPFDCKLCGATFLTKAVLMKHSKIKHTLNILKNKSNGEISSLKSKSKGKGGRNRRRRKIRISNPLEVTCVFCNKRCKARGEFFDHINSHTGERPFDCKLCGATFRRKSVLTIHSKAKHSSAREVKFKCELCQKTFRNQNCLWNHKRHVHERKEILQCSICLKMFTCKGNILQHLRGVHRSEFTDEPSKWKEFFVDVPVPEEVKATEEAFLEWRKLYNQKIAAGGNRIEGPKSDLVSLESNWNGNRNRRRIKRVKNREISSGNKSSFAANTCVFCGIVTKYPSQLKRHMLFHIGEKPEICELCGEECRTPQDLKAHFNRLHDPSRKNWYKCDQCNRSYPSSLGLYFHKKRHHVEKRKSHRRKQKNEISMLTCVFCDKKFKWATDLNVHLLSHTDERPFFCQICDASLKTKSSLKSHVIAVHNPTSEFPFKCEVCEKSFAFKYRLQTHKLIHEFKKFSCDICSKRFTNKYKLDSHLFLVHNLRKDEAIDFENATVVSAPSTIRTLKQLRAWKALKKIEELQDLNGGDGINSKAISKIGRHIPLFRPSQFKLQCQFCSAEYNNYGCMRTHVLLYHNELSRNHGGPYRCVECQSCFGSIRTLRVHHQKDHLGVETFRCSKCLREFPEHGDLERHHKTNKHYCEKVERNKKLLDEPFKFRMSWFRSRVKKAKRRKALFEEALGEEALDDGNHVNDSGIPMEQEEEDNNDRQEAGEKNNVVDEKAQFRKLLASIQF